MSDQTWNRDLVEHILSLVDFLKANGVAIDQCIQPETAELMSQFPKFQAAYAMMRLMDEIPGGFIIYHADGDEKLVYANKGLLRMYQCESWEEFDALTGGTFRGMVHPEDIEDVEQSIAKQIADSQFDLDYVEYRIIRKDGSIGWVEDYGHFVHGKLAGDFFYVFLGDATEKWSRQRDERQRIERRFQGLIEKYDRERSLINQEYLRRLEVIEGLSINYESILHAQLEENSILPYRLSCRTQRQFGEKFQVRELRWYLTDYVKVWVHPEDREMVARETDPDYMREQLLQKCTYYLNYRVIYQGEIQYLQLRIVNVGQRDHVDQVVMGYRRVDEELRREMEQKQLLAEALDHAKLSLEARNEFLSNMSHDMRTPLNAIFGFTELAKNSSGDPEAVQGYLEQIAAFSRQLLDTIEKVLEMSWAGSGEIVDEETECDLCRVVRDVYDSMLSQATEKNLDFTLKCRRVTHSRIYGDQPKLKQLVGYLIQNALTYTKPGGRVSITLEEQERLLSQLGVYRLTVEDTGIGIGKEFLKHIFEPFARERNTTISGIHGIGLGLTIVKRIVDRMGGDIQVSSDAGKGSVFTVTLRFRMCADPSADQGSGAHTQAQTSVRSILLVEDNKINLELETAILQEAGFSIDTAQDGRAAVEKVSSAAPGEYDLILMDIQMPVMDGWQAAQEIRGLEDSLLAGIPIIALSANAFESDVRRSLESGMDAHLSKPLDVAELMKTIQEVKQQRELYPRRLHQPGGQTGKIPAENS